MKGSSPTRQTQDALARVQIHRTMVSQIPLCACGEVPRPTDAVGGISRKWIVVDRLSTSRACGLSIRLDTMVSAIP